MRSSSSVDRPPIRRPGPGPAVAARAVVLAAAAAVAVVLPLQAQEDSDPSLRAVEAAADSGRLDRARGLLERWRGERAAAAGLDQLRRAEFLAARLAADADSARRLYARLAVEAGGELGSRARLRLAQLHLAEGSSGPALRQLELVRSDLPGDALAAESWLWTGRARLAEGDTSAACDALRRAADAGADLRDRAARATSGCGLEAPDDRVTITPDSAGSRDATREATGATGEAAATAWSVQLGAFSARAAADRVRERAREAGWEPRRLPPGADGLHRVRVGRWTDRAEAEEAARSMEEEGFRVLVVEARATDADS